MSIRSTNGFILSNSGDVGRYVDRAGAGAVGRSMEGSMIGRPVGAAMVNEDLKSLG